MLSLQLFRQNKDLIIEGLKKKNFKDLAIVDAIIALDEKRRQIQVENDRIASELNAASKSIGQLMGQGKKEEAEGLKNEVASKKEAAKEIAQQLAALEAEQQDLLIRLPNLPHSSVPVGKTPEENEVVRTGGQRPDLSAQKLAHWDLTNQYKLIDFELGNKITGSGFPVYMGKGAKLQRALIAYFLDYNTAAGYGEVYPPFMVNEASAYGTGQLPDKEGQMYHATADNCYLIPTAEVTAYTPCFRREAGSYGKDVRGLNRLHQFDKVEIVQFTHPDKSYEALEGMVLHVEQLLQQLGLEYRILRLCGGDMSFTSALTYDFEVYSAAQERWLEVSSVSNFESFQTNRCKIRFKNAEGKTQLLHSLNGSSLALPRILACLLENCQTPEGIVIPEVLRPYFGADKIN